jgi:hypothetical protein
MPTLITAGDATTGLVQTAASDGALNIQTGPAGSKVNAIALSSAGGATFSQITGGALTLATAQATTSGTNIDFTGIPSWVKRITLMLNGVSTNGTSALLAQVGAGSITTSGYNSMAFTNATLGTSTAGFLITQAVSAALNQYGAYTINLFGSNTWILQGVGYQSPSFGAPAAGQIALAGTLDRLRLTTVAGTDAFDAGSVNIMYEG